MIVSRIMSKSQTTGPKAVRDALAYMIDEDGEVRIHKAKRDTTVDLGNRFATFTEWADPLDDADDDL